MTTERIICGIGILMVLLAIGMQSCSAKVPASVALTADDCKKPARCYL